MDSDVFWSKDRAVGSTVGDLNRMYDNAAAGAADMASSARAMSEAAFGTDLGLQKLLFASEVVVTDGKAQEVPMPAQEDTEEARAIDVADKSKRTAVEAQSRATRKKTEWIDVGFADVGCGYSEASEMGVIRVLGRDGEHQETNLERMMEFLDRFVDSEDAASGFSITYDFRMMRMPSMSMVTRIAEWGGEPHRQAKWERLNLACKVVVTSGSRYALCKGILAAFFLVCPPVCPTYLLTDPDEPEESSTVFAPAVPLEKPAKGKPVPPSGGRGHSLPPPGAGNTSAIADIRQGGSPHQDPAAWLTSYAF